MKLTMKTLGERIRSARTKQGLQQKDVASKTGLAPATVSNWENGVGSVGVIEFIDLWKALGVPLENLLPELAAFLPGVPAEHQTQIAQLGQKLLRIQQLAPNAQPSIIQIANESADSTLKWAEEFHAKSMIQGAEDARVSPLPPLRLVDGPSKSGVRHRLFENLAAGVAGQVEALDRVCHVAELADRQNISLLVVQGESMLPTLKPGDVAVVRHVEPPFELAPMRKGDKKRPLHGLRAVVGDGQLMVFTLNNEGEAVKRAHFRGRDDDWQMVLGADNLEWAREHQYPLPISRGDVMRIYGQVLGVAR